MPVKHRFELFRIEDVIDTVIDLVVRPIETNAVTKHPRLNSV